jgi:hypothetical protein
MFFARQRSPKEVECRPSIRVARGVVIAAKDDERQILATRIAK